MKHLIKNISLLILCIMLVPITAKANIICNDGTISPSCSYCHSGCCSHHGGCANSSDTLTSNDNYIELTGTNCEYNQADIDGLKENIASLQSDLNDRDEDANLYGTLFFITLSTFIGYFIYKNKNNDICLKWSKKESNNQSTIIEINELEQKKEKKYTGKVVETKYSQKEIGLFLTILSVLLIIVIIFVLVIK